MRLSNDKSGIATAARVPSEVAVALAFFVSGTGGLIFEVVWFHRCGLVFGNSVWSTSIVLSSFMGGLALGGALIGWYGHRINRFLRTYAILEVVVAVTGLALTYALPEVTRIFVPGARLVFDQPWLVNVIRLAMAFAMLMVPATAMGATMPLLVTALSHWRAGFGRALGRLYGWNTLGAVTGVLGAETVLITRVGVRGSAWCAALLNLSAAAAALWISRRSSESQRVVEGAAARPTPPARQVWRLLACAFLAGGSLMALEVVWFRFLSMFVINTTLAIILMLAVVLAGIALGGLTASAWLNRRPCALTYLPTVALAAACVSAASYVCFQFVIDGPQRGAVSVARDTRLDPGEWYRIIWLACALTLPTSLLSGVLFTLLGEALERDIGIETHAAGWLALANTTGAMCGPPIATFGLLPVLGMERAFFALAALYGVIGLLAIWKTLPILPTGAKRAFVVAALATGLVFARFPFGMMIKRYFARSAELYTIDGSKVIATREGPTETIFLMEQTWLGKPLYYRLVTNGFSMSGTHVTSQRYMRYFVYWPMLLRQAPLRRVLVICYGVGVTAAAVTDVDSVESLDVVETSRDVISMSDIVYPPAEQPLRDRRMRLHLEDGRQFLQVTDQQFDLITGEPPPPLTPGTVNLYTREYFQLIYDRLAQGGITTYWLPIAARGQYQVTPIIRAFCDVFEDCSLWNGTPRDWMLVGTRQAALSPSEAAFSKWWDHPLVGPHLREIGFEVPQQIGATFLGDASYLKGLTAETPPLTDDYPQRLLSVSGRQLASDLRDSLSLDLFGAVIDSTRARRSFEQSAFIRSLWPEGLLNDTLRFFDDQGIINRLILEGSNPLRYIEEIHALITKTSLRRLLLWELGSNEAVQRVADTGNDGTGTVEYEVGVRALAIRNYSAAARFLAESEQRGFRAKTLRPLRVYALCLAGEPKAARNLIPDIEPTDPDERHFWSWLMSEFGVGRHLIK